ncbi:MAG: tryptophan--tRNA ligase, partial [Parasphingorhabdus sp.]
WLDRMTQFKEKSGKHKQRSSLGLLGYPVLQAADVLLYQATHVPVGDDQKQHLELARDIATKFNSDTGTETFTLPEPFIGKTAARIMSLRDGNAKMSKSDPSDLSRINMSDDNDMIARKMKKAKTDPEPLPDNMADLAERPEAKNLIGIYSALADQSQDAVIAEYAGKGFGDFKPALADLAVSKLSPIRERFEELRKDTGAIDAILREGSEKASALARPTVEAAYAALGLLRN